MITRQHTRGLEVFTIGGTGEMLPVFSFEEEAEMFLGFWHAADGWQVRETACGELVSVLYGPCREVEQVTLDPVPVMVEFVSLSRERFIEVVLSEVTPPAVETVGAAY